MPFVGLCGEPKEALEKIEYMVQTLSLQEQFSEEEPVRTEKSGQTEFVRITEKSVEELENLDCLIWSGSCENAVSEEADRLLEEYPRLAVIFRASSPKRVMSRALMSSRNASSGMICGSARSPCVTSAVWQ